MPFTVNLIKKYELLNRPTDDGCLDDPEHHGTSNGILTILTSEKV